MRGRKGKHHTLPPAAGSARNSGSKGKKASSGKNKKEGSKVKPSVPAPSHCTKPKEQPVSPHAKDDCKVDPCDGSKLEQSGAGPSHRADLAEQPASSVKGKRSIAPEVFTGAGGIKYVIYACPSPPQAPPPGHKFPPIPPIAMDASFWTEIFPKNYELVELSCDITEEELENLSSDESDDEDTSKWFSNR